MTCWRSKECHVLKNLHNKKEVIQTVRELLNWSLNFSSNTGYNFSLSVRYDSKLCLPLKKLLTLSRVSHWFISLRHSTFKRKWLKQGVWPLPEIGIPSISRITGELVSATMSLALFWWSQKFLYFFSILLQFRYW